MALEKTSCRIYVGKLMRSESHLFNGAVKLTLRMTMKGPLHRALFLSVITITVLAGCAATFVNPRHHLAKVVGIGPPLSLPVSVRKVHCSCGGHQRSVSEQMFCFLGGRVIFWHPDSAGHAQCDFRHSRSSKSRSDSLCGQHDGAR